MVKVVNFILGKLYLPLTPISLLGTDPTGITSNMNRDSCTKRFTAVLLITQEKREGVLKCPITGKRVNKLWSTTQPLK